MSRNMPIINNITATIRRKMSSKKSKRRSITVGAKRENSLKTSKGDKENRPEWLRKTDAAKPIQMEKKSFKI